MHQKEVIFNILGSCVCRDIFSIPDPSYLVSQNYRYQVNKFLQFSSPVSFTKPQGPTTISTEMLAQMDSMSPFDKKCVTYDFNRTNLNATIGESNYYIFDLTEFRFRLGRIYMDGKEHWFTATDKFKEVFQYLRSRDPLWASASDVEEVVCTPDEWVNATKQWMEAILSVYPQENCILFENYLVHDYIDTKTGKYLLGNEGYADAMNEKLWVVYSYVKETFPQINVVQNPQYNIGNLYHKWGRDSLHFMDSFYIYGIQALSLIVETPDLGIRKEKLLALYNEYSRIFKSIRNEAILTTILSEHLHAENLLKGAFFNDFSAWNSVHSRHSGFELTNKRLYCNDEGQGWSILTQTVPHVSVDAIKHQNLTFSICAATQQKCKFYLSLGYYSENKYVWLKTDAKTAERQVKRFFITDQFPQNLPQDAVLSCRVYVNQTGSSVQLEHAGLCFGTVPSDWIEIDPIGLSNP